MNVNVPDLHPILVEIGRQWGDGSEYAERSADWTALWKKMNEEPNQIMERVGSHLIYER